MKAKLGTLSAIVLIVGMFYGIWRWEDGRDVVIAMRMEPDTLMADGRSYATLRFTVTDPDGTPRAGDVLTLVRTQGHGQLKANRIKTDDRGEAVVDYYSYREGPFTPVTVNVVTVTDISVGKIVGVKKSASFEIPLAKPDHSSPEQADETGGESGRNGTHIPLGGGGG